LIHLIILLFLLIPK